MLLPLPGPSPGSVMYSDLEVKPYMATITQYKSGMSNGFFITENDSVIAVDGGAEYGREYAEKACADAGIDPKTVRLIVASHAHVDHTCNLGELKALTGAPIAVCKAGAEDMKTAQMPRVFPRNAIGDKIMEFAKSKGGMPDDYLPPIVPDVVWEDELDLRPYGIAGKVIYTPGHSLSDSCVVLEDGQAIVGDLIVDDEFTEGVPCIAYFGYTPDREKANEMLFPSCERLLQAGATKFYSGHGGPFTLEQFQTALAQARAEANAL